MTEQLSTPGFFTSGLGAYDTSNPFDHAFKDNGTGMDHSRHSFNFAKPNNEAGFSPYFGFSPRTSPAPDYSRPQRQQIQMDLDGMSLGGPSNVWNPPNAEQPTSVDPHLRQPSPLDKLLTQNLQTTARAHHGQITPPSDNTPSGDVWTGKSGEQEQQQTIAASTGRRRKQTSQASQASEPTTTTRRRKSTSSRKQSTPSTVKEETDEKRSKFLERNRVAASKCRQKKKEWTTNLEQRARELQNSKNHLSMVVGSLREEMLYLKGEVLKHNNCNCSSMREYLNREVLSISHGPPGAPAGGAYRGVPTGSEGQDAMDMEQSGQFNDSPHTSAMSFADSPQSDREMQVMLSAQLDERQ